MITVLLKTILCKCISHNVTIFISYLYKNGNKCCGFSPFEYRKSPARSRAAYIRGRLVGWVYKPWMKGLGGLYLKYSICLSIFIYKPRLVNESGLNMRVAYPINFFPNKNNPQSIIAAQFLIGDIW